MTDVLITELASRIKDEIKSLTAQRNSVQVELKVLEEKASKILTNAGMEARKIVEEAQSQAQLIEHQLTQRENKVKEAESILQRLDEESKRLSEELLASNQAKNDLLEKEKEFQAKKVETEELKHQAELLYEQEVVFATEKGITVEPFKEEEKKEKKSKKKE